MKYALTLLCFVGITGTVQADSSKQMYGILMPKPVAQPARCDRRVDLGREAFLAGPKRIEVFSGGVFYLQVRYLKCTQFSDFVQFGAIDFPKDLSVRLTAYRGFFKSLRLKGEVLPSNKDNEFDTTVKFTATDEQLEQLKGRWVDLQICAAGRCETAYKLVLLE